MIEIVLISYLIMQIEAPMWVNVLMIGGLVIEITKFYLRTCSFMKGLIEGLKNGE